MAAVSPSGSSQLRMTLPSGRGATLGEKLPLPVGDAISRRLLLVRDSARFEWQPKIKQLKKIDAKTFTMVLEVIRMISFNELPWQHACRWGISSGCHGNALPSVMKPVANLDKNFAWIQIMRSAKGKAVIQ
jgi:hypothetical protein